MALRQRNFGLRRKALDLRQVEAVRLAAAAADAKALLADAGQPEKAVRQLMKIDNLGQRPDIEGFCGTDLAALAYQHHAETCVLAHAGAHHIHVASFENSQRQRTFRK